MHGKLPTKGLGCGRSFQGMIFKIGFRTEMKANDPTCFGGNSSVETVWKVGIEFGSTSARNFQIK